MKKTRLILCAVLCIAMLCVAAFAAETVEADQNGAYSVTYDGSAGEYYAILVVSGTYADNETPVISESTILYINQVTADEDGNAAFTSFKTKTNEDATVYIGGSDLDSAVLYGYISAGSSEVTVSGTVATETVKPATVKLTSTADSTKVYSVATENGSFEISVAADTYKLEITAPSHLSYTKNALVVEADVSDISVALKGGDVNASDEVNPLDLNELLTALVTQDEASDINGSGEVNALDLNIIISNLGATSIVE